MEELGPSAPAHLPVPSSPHPRLQSVRQQKSQGGELAVQLERVQALLKQRDAAVAQLTSQLDAARSRPGSSSGAAPMAAAPAPRAPLSRHNSDVNAQAQQAMADKLAELGLELGEKEKRIASLEEDLAEARGCAQGRVHACCYWRRPVHWLQLCQGIE